MPSFIFTISSTDLGGSVVFPVSNGGGSFTGVTTDISPNTPITGTTTMTYTWTNYTNLSGNDGLSFNTNVVSYGTKSSINITQFGGIPLPNMYYGNAPFFGFAGQISCTDVPTIPNNNLDSCFYNSTCSNFGNIGSWDISGVTKMNSMFNGCINFNQDISGWNTSKVTGTIDNLFANCRNFNQNINTSGNYWNLSNVSNMSYMFANCTNFNQPIGSWNTSNVTNMNSMFQNATSFNQPIGSWTTSNVSNMNSMFQNATSFNQPIGSWTTSNVSNMNSMFQNATSFNQPIGNWNFSKISNSTTKILNFIQNTGFSLSQTLVFLTNLINNITINNVSLGNISGIRSIYYQSISNGLQNKSITVITPNIYDLILAKNYLFSYTFTITYNSSIVFNGLLIVDYSNNIKYIEDSNTQLPLTIVYDYSFGANYMISNNKFTSGGTNILNIAYFNNIFPLAIEYQLTNNKLNYFNGSTWIIIGTNIVSNLTSIPLTTELYNKFKYTATELKIAGYTITELKVAGYTATDLKVAGFTATELKVAGFTATDLKIAGYTATDLKIAGYTATELKIAGYTATELKVAGFTATDLKIAGYTATDLKIEGYTATDLKIAGYTATDLKIEGYTATDLKIAGYTVTELKVAGFTATELKVAGFTATDLKVAGFTATELKVAGYTATELKVAGYSIISISDAGYSTFIFTISISDWNNSNKYPVSNYGGSFTGIAYDTLFDKNTVTIYWIWTSYINLNTSDGLSFNPNIVPYGSSSSINIIQFGRIPLPTIISLSNACFVEFTGIITGTDILNSDKYKLPPSIISLSSNKSSTNGGKIININGGNLINVNSVLFSNSVSKTFASNLKILDNDKLTLITPSMNEGIVNTIIATKYASTLLLNNFIYKFTPIIQSMDLLPDYIVGYKLFNIKGLNLLNTESVLFGEELMDNIQIISNSQIIVKTPYGKDGIVKITLDGSYGMSSLSKYFSYKDYYRVSLNSSKLALIQNNRQYYLNIIQNNKNKY
jgi:surface protein